MFSTVTCHLHFWRNDRDLSRATAVTRGWNGYRNKSQHRKLTPEKKIFRRFRWDSKPGPFDHDCDALTTELPPLLKRTSGGRSCSSYRVCVTATSIYIYFTLLIAATTCTVVNMTIQYILQSTVVITTIARCIVFNFVTVC